MRSDENGNPCPETLKEYRDLCLAVGGKDCRAVEFLEDKIEASGEDDKVVVADSQMRAILMPMLIQPRSCSCDEPHTCMEIGGKPAVPGCPECEAAARPMPRTPTPSELIAVALAKHIVKSWEDAESMAAVFQAKFGASDELRDQLVKDYKEAAGGEDLYKASVEFLRGRDGEL